MPETSQRLAEDAYPPTVVAARHELTVRHKLVFELGWRGYYRHVWRHRGAAIEQSLHPGPLPDDCYAASLPADIRWQGDAATLGAALGSARRVRGVADPHLAPWLEQLGVWQEPPALFPRVDRPCDSFSAWWRLVTAGLTSATEILANREDASP